MIIDLFILTVITCTAPQTQPASSRPADVLVGPSADEGKTPPSIVSRHFDGTLEDIGPEPDVAAVKALELTAAQRTRFDEILLARHIAFDEAVRANYGLIVELGTLANEPDPTKRLELLNKVRFAFEQFFKRGTFVDEFSDQLNNQQREQINEMLGEYREEKLKEVQRQNGLARPQAAHRARLEAFGQMVRESIERQVGLEREHFEQLALELDLTEEQKNKAQAIFGPVAVKKLQNLDVAKDQADAFAQFRRTLTHEQRGKLLAIIVKTWLPPQTAPPTSAPSTQPER